MKRVLNGGPLTLEFSMGIFRDEESIRKLSMLVRYFIQRGGHQLQLNAVDPDVLHRAQADPDRYRQLIVRIWGWSAYFTELDKECAEFKAWITEEHKKDKQIMMEALKANGRL